MGIRGNQLLRKVISVIGAAGTANQIVPTGFDSQVVFGGPLPTAGTRFNIAHGLGFAPKVWAVKFQNLALDDDVAAQDAVFSVISATSTNLNCKASVAIAQAKLNFLVLIDLDQGGGVGFKPSAGT